MFLIPALLLITSTTQNQAELNRRLDRVTAETPSRLAAVETARFLVQSGEKKKRKSGGGEWKEAVALIEALEAGGDPLQGRTGDMHQAYRSTLDGTIQPYRLYAPTSLEAERTYPLLVVLHGHHGDENSYFDLYRDRATGDRMLLRLAEERGYFVVAPRGRGPGTRYTGDAEQDVLDVIDRVTALYPIDESQIYLSGHSSGGVGTWKIGFRFAQRFAALAAVGSAFRYQPAELSRLPLTENNDKPLLYVQGRQDRLATNRYAANLVDFLGPRLQNFVYKEFPDGHNSLGATSLPTVFDFFDSVRRGDPLMESDTVSPQPVLVAARNKSRVSYRSTRKVRSSKRTRASAKHRTSKRTMSRKSVTAYKKQGTKRLPRPKVRARHNPRRSAKSK
ncbi:MAG: alpha/beta fold hydrolase [Bryobacteraceae bacterium]